MRRGWLIFCMLLSIWINRTISTDICYAYRWNIYCIRDADTETASNSTYLFNSLHVHPVGLTYGEQPCDDEQKPCLKVPNLYFSEINHDSGTLLYVNVNEWWKNAPYGRDSVKTLIKRDVNSPIPMRLEYDVHKRNVYTTTATNPNFISVANLNKEHSLLKNHPSVLPKKENKPSQKILDFTMDHCNRRLFWIEGNSNSTVLQCRSLDSINITAGEIDMQLSHQEFDADKLCGKDPLLSNTDVNSSWVFTAVHYDPHVDSLILALTDTNSSTTSFLKVSIRSDGHKQVTVLTANPLTPSIPYDLTCDEKYIYWSDWAAEGVMRLDKDKYTTLEKIQSTPPANDYRGAREIVALENPLQLCKKPVMKFESQQNNNSIKEKLNTQSDEEVISSTETSSSHSVVREINEPQTTYSPLATEKQLVIKVLSSTEYTRSVNLNKNSLVSEKKNSTEVTVVEAPPKSFQPIEEVPVERTSTTQSLSVQPMRVDHSSSIIIWSMTWREEDISTVMTALLCMTIFFIVTTILLLWLRCRKWLPSTPELLRNNRFSQSPSKYTKSFSEDEEVPNSVIVDLTTDSTEQGISSAGTVSCNIKKKKPKVFRPRGDKIKKLVPKSQASGQTCSHDGVFINIEDCCDMALCDVPCYTAIKKEGRGYLRFETSSSKAGLLDHCHTSC